MADPGVNVLIFGGCGFVGRNLVELLIDEGYATFVRVVDKVPPQVAWLNKKHQKIFNDARVEFRSANLINQASCEIAFEGAKFDYVINCACETKPGQSDLVYEEGVYRVSINCAVASAKNNVQRFIELSSGQVFNSEKVAHKEEDKVEPWTNIAKYKLKVEQELKNIENLNFTIIRPATVYGLGDKTALGIKLTSARLLIAGVYKHLGEEMKLLWNKDLAMNTVHVRDLCRAIWHVTTLEEARNQIYNVVDDSRSTQGSITDAIASIFNIKYDYWGNAASSLCKVC
uniref:Epimerase domain-containing protein n=1 Tax=Rhodnius prolixus TaxID=13249 RepID=T1HA61_RHOPR